MSRLLVALCLAAAQHAQAAKVLMVLTSHNKLGEKEGKQTGWYLPEAAHPFKVFKDAGVEMVWASPRGGRAPVDKGSVETYTKGDQADEACIDFMTKHKHVWMHTQKLSNTTDDQFDAVFVVGGYGVMWDLVGNRVLADIILKINGEHGVVSGVCHGPAVFAKVRLPDGTPLAKDKEVACFSNDEEDAMQLRETVPETCEDSYNDAGAKYTKGDPWSDHVSVAGNLITGQNPMSAKSTAEAVVKALNGGNHKDEAKNEEKADLDFSVKTSLHPGSKVGLATACGSAALLGAAALLSLHRRRQRSSEAPLSDIALMAEEPAVE